MKTFGENEFKQPNPLLLQLSALDKELNWGFRQSHNNALN